MTVFRWKHVQIAVLIAVLAPIGCATTTESVSAQTSSPNTPSPTTPSPNTIKGVMTRSQTSIILKEQLSVLPDLQDQTLATYLSQLETRGVNVAIINVQPDYIPAYAIVKPPATEPQCTMTPDMQSAVTDTDWANYRDAIYLPNSPQSLQSNAQATAFLKVRGQISALDCTTNYTVQQQDSLIFDFLARVQEVYDKGLIQGNIKFILDDREWFKDPQDPTTHAYMPGISDYNRSSAETRFANDISNIINMTLNDSQQRHLDKWLYGVRLKEHNNGTMNELLPIAVDLATRINAQTGNWLTTHTFIVNGGYLGADYNGIQSTVCPAQPNNPQHPEYQYQFTCVAGNSFPFFQLIKAQTGAFAFGYKWMEFNAYRWNDGVLYNSMDALAAGYCTKFIQGCDPGNITMDQWRTFLVDDVNGLGFEDLRYFINNYAAAYPNWAQVLFEGDNSDALIQMVTDSPSGLVDQPQMQALRYLFQGAAGVNPESWNGHIFTLAYVDTDSYNAKETAQNVNGRAQYYVDYVGNPTTQDGYSGSGAATLYPHTYSFWNNWPNAPQ